MQNPNLNLARSVALSCAMVFITFDDLRAADEAAVHEALTRQIVSPDLVLMEVEHFCDSRVPRMPAVVKGNVVLVLSSWMAKR